MRMTSRVVARGPAETEVTVSSTVNITGILAQFGRGIVQDVSEQMFGRFTEAMRTALESASDPAGADRQAGGGPAAERSAADGPDAPRPPADSAGAPRPGAASAGAEAAADTAAGRDAPAGDAIDAVSLGAAVGGRAFRRLVRRPAFWLAVGIVAVVLWLMVD